MSRRAWLGFAAVLIATLLVAALVGRLRWAEVAVPPTASARAGQPVEVRGVRYELARTEQLASVADFLGESQPAPAGAVWLHVVLRAEVVAAEIDPDEHSCELTLETDTGTWDSRTSEAVAQQWPIECAEDSRDDARTLRRAGQSKEIHGLWLVPRAALAHPRVLVRFSRPRGAFEVQV